MYFNISTEFAIIHYTNYNILYILQEDKLWAVFGVASKEDCVFDLFFGIDYHAHLGTRRAGMAVYDKKTALTKQFTI